MLMPFSSAIPVFVGKIAISVTDNKNIILSGCKKMTTFHRDLFIILELPVLPLDRPIAHHRLLMRTAKAAAFTDAYRG